MLPATHRHDRAESMGRKSTKTATLLVAVVPLLLTLAVAPPAARAGCGCDHPPPEWAPVMPIFAPPGASIRIFAENRGFDVGSHYQVRIDGVELSSPVRATNPGYVDAVLPDEVSVGPASIEVYRKSHSWFWGSYTRRWASYDDGFFTVLPRFVEVPAKSGVYESRDFEIAIDATGNVLLPIDLSNVLGATQFAFQFEGFRLSFAPEDIVMYNKDGVDLTLFTLAIDEGSRRVWGSYQGWEVEEDKDIRGVRFQNRTGRARDVTSSSDTLTYWRHEFRTFAFAHMEGMSHEVDADGYHPDASLHIDHDYVIIAFHGMQRSAWFPDLERFDREPKSGSKRVRLRVAVKASPHPVEPGIMLPMIEKARRTESLEDYIAHRQKEHLQLGDLDEWLHALDPPGRAVALDLLNMSYEEAVTIAQENMRR